MGEVPETTWSGMGGAFCAFLFREWIFFLDALCICFLCPGDFWKQLLFVLRILPWYTYYVWNDDVDVDDDDDDDDDDGDDDGDGDGDGVDDVDIYDWWLMIVDFWCMNL